ATKDVIITVTPEGATLEYTGDAFRTTTANSVSVNVSALVTQDADSNLGDLSLTKVQFTVQNFGGSTISGGTCTVPVVPAVGGATGTAGCAITVPVSTDPYTVTVHLIGNDYFLAEDVMSGLTVAVAGTGFTTGGGWLVEPKLGTKSNFGFTAKNVKNGIQGNSLYIYRQTLAAGN